MNNSISVLVLVVLWHCWRKVLMPICSAQGMQQQYTWLLVLNATLTITLRWCSATRQILMCRMCLVFFYWLCYFWKCCWHLCVCVFFLFSGALIVLFFCDAVCCNCGFVLTNFIRKLLCACTWIQFCSIVCESLKMLIIWLVMIKYSHMWQ